MTLCPYCKAELTGDAALPVLRPRYQRVYRAALEAGSDGIDSGDLLVRMYAEDEWPTPGGATVLRVVIHEVNKIIAQMDQRIVNLHRGRYRLISTLEVKNEEKVQQAANP